MKRIEAIIRLERLGPVREALAGLEHRGMSVMAEITGHGVQGGITQKWRGKDYHVDLLPKAMIVAVVQDHEVQETIETIVSSARTGDIGDGKVFITPVEEVVRIRTGERGPQAV